MRVAGSGVIDRTRFHGARAVSLECRLAATPAAKVDALTRMLGPAARPRLIVTDTDWEPWPRRALRVRVDQYAVCELIHTSSWFRDVSVQWTAPEGIWTAADTVRYEIDLGADGRQGRVYRLRSPRVYEATGATGVVSFDNPGTSTSEWTARLHGPCTGPRLTCDDTGDAVVFDSSFRLAAGEFVELDSAHATVYAQGNASLSRLHRLDFASSSWWKIRPGTNTIRFNPTSGVDTGARASIEFRPSWI